jgi:catechol-2,3-dioxygenase
MSAAWSPDRRQVLAGATALIAAHCGFAPAPASDKRPEPGLRIAALELLTAAPLAKMKQFYGESLGLKMLTDEAGRLVIVGGGTRLTFRPAPRDAGAPFYHFAFNIPENKALAAHKWQTARSSLLPIPARLRDPKFPDDVVHYRHWNAHSVFFLDPGGNVVSTSPATT